MEQKKEVAKQSTYNRPPMDLLSVGATREEVEKASARTAQAIVEKLHIFGIDVEYVGSTVGPAFTQYRFKALSAQTRMSEFTGYEADLAACAECSGTVRIEAPLSGTDLVGIDIPNKVRTQTVLRDLFESKEMAQATGGLVFPIGRATTGEVVTADLCEMSHLLIGGTTGSGKSLMVHSLINSLMYKYSPEYVRFLLVDLKLCELGRYNGMPHMLTHDSLTTCEQTLNALDYLNNTMEYRYKLMRDKGVANIAEYNAEVASSEKLPYILLVVDELADVMHSEGRRMEIKIRRIAQKARAVGIHMVLCTQRPDGKVVSTLIRTNMPCRIAFKTVAPMDSVAIIGSPDAAKLLGWGDMLYMTPNNPALIRLQGAYISCDEIDAVKNYITKNNHANFDSEVERAIGTLIPHLTATANADPWCKKALQMCIKENEGKVTCDYIQRRFKIDFNRVNKIIEDLVRLKLIKPVIDTSSQSTQPVASITYKTVVSMEELDTILPAMEEYLECNSNSFEKIKGYKNIKEELKCLADIMVNKQYYEKVGVTTPKGLLLYGDPGLGKTLMANCLISAVGRHVYICRKNKSNGAFVDEIKNVFEQAVQNQPSIVFLDDMDKFANEDDNHKNAEEYVTIQSCIDEVKDKDVFVLATANSIYCMPNSLIRAGRFDRVIHVSAPKGNDALEILQYYLGKKSNVQNVDAEEIARIMSGHSCAELETVINEAAIYAGAARKDHVDMDDVVRACMRIVFRAPEELSESSSKYIKQIAYHEAGHAVIGEILEPGSINIVSVQKYDCDVGGVTSFTPAEGYELDFHLMENRILSLLGGRAATEIVFGAVDVGATEDLGRVSKVLDRFIDNYAAFGFDKFNGTDFNCSSALRERLEMQKAVEMDRYYKQAKQILLQNRKFLDALANALAEKKILLRKDIQEIRKACVA